MSEGKYKVRLTSNVKLGKNRHTSGDYVQVDKEVYDKFKAKELINDEFTEEVEKAQDPDEGSEKELKDYTVPELKAYAEKHAIELGSASRKDDILEAIEEFNNLQE